jgi:L-asparaginase
MKPRILILYAGGTIGMRPGALGLIPSKQFLFDLQKWVDQQPEIQHCEFVFQIHEPLIDSAEAIPSYWSSVALALYAGREKFDSAIVLHGTDTLAYTASALSFLLGGLGKAVILTGAQIPFGSQDSDAASNIRGAILCASKLEITEVCIFFDGILLRGNRTQKSSTRVGNSFVSPHWPELGRVGANVKLNVAALLPPARERQVPITMSDASIGLLKLYPGISEQVIAAFVEAHPSGLVLELYGSGTGPSMNEAVLNAFKRAIAAKTPVVGVSQCPHGEVTAPSYATSRILRDIGVINGRDMTSEAALTKLHFLWARRTPWRSLAGMLERPLAGELTISSEKELEAQIG